MGHFILRCPECESELASDDPGFIEHHGDGSHTRYFLDGEVAQTMVSEDER